MVAMISMRNGLKAMVLLLGLALWVPAAEAGEAGVTRARGNSIALDQGADAGLIVGMTVSVRRPPNEAIIHPITGENLGAPEVEIGRAEITKTSGRAASARLVGTPLVTVQAGDRVVFTTLDEEMVADQEQKSQTQDEAALDRKKLRGETAKLAREVRGIQGTIRTLENMMKRLDRVDEVIKVQLRSINQDMTQLKDEVGQLKETVSLMGAVPIDDISEGDQSSEEEMARMRALIQEEIGSLKMQVPAADPAVIDADVPPLPEELESEPELPVEEMIEEEAPFYQQLWFYGILLFAGLMGLAYFLWSRMQGGGDEDEELEEDEEFDDEDEDDLEIEGEEEDDIVVEETN
jgi:hypothetical protein